MEIMMLLLFGVFGFKMENINKMKKQRMNMKIAVISIILLIALPALVSAAMYETLQSLESRDCNLIERDGVSSAIKTALINKFGLTGGGNCSFVLDYMPYHSDTIDFIWLEDIGYAEVDYIINGSEEYLLILGQDSSTLNEITDFIANYETYQYYLKSYGDYPYLSLSFDDVILFPDNFLTEIYDPAYTGPENMGCVDNAVKSVYLGNSGFYQDGEVISFSSSCSDANTISYGFCFANSFINLPYECDCVNGKCIANMRHIFYYFNLYGQFAGPGGRLVNGELIASAVSSWIDN